MQSLVACRVANLAFFKPNFEIQAFLTHLFFLKIKNTSQNLAFSFLFFSV